MAAAAATPVVLSIADYLNTSYKPDVDFVDGQLEERNLGEFDHARLRILIGSIFVANERTWGITTVTEQRIRVTPSRVRIADIAILRAEAPREKVTATPPLLGVEVLSPKDRFSRVQVRLEDYLAMGVAQSWLIEPSRRSAYMFDANGLHPGHPTRLTVPNTPIAVDLTEAFLALD